MSPHTIIRKACLLLSILLPLSVSARSHKLSKWNITAADYSGITALGDGRYAVVSDKESGAGFFVWNISVNPYNGALTSVVNEGWRGVEYDYARDAEGIAYCHARHSVFVSGEEDQRILEHRLDGSLTGYEMDVPSAMGKDAIQPNRGFEALCYDSLRHLFWTTTESNLKTDSAGVLRLLCFGDDLQLRSSALYTMDAPALPSTGREHIHGVVALCALDDGSLLVMEREAHIAKRYVGSRCVCTLFRFTPSTGDKKLIHRWSSKFTLANTRFANYEGLCLGPKLRDGRQTLLLISDAQGGYGKAFWHLRDRIEVYVM